MSQSSVDASETKPVLPPLLWLGYALLGAAFLLSSVNTLFGWLTVAAVILAYRLRTAQLKQGNALAVQHATWQIHTFWIMTLLFLLIIALALVFLGLLGANDAAMAQLNAISDAMQNGSISLMEGGRQMWGVPEARHFIMSILGMSLLLLWPLARVFKGAFALARAKSPQNLGFAVTLLSWLAAVLTPSLVLVLL